MLVGLFNYWVVVILMMIGFYIVIAHGNLIKKIVGLTIFQTSVFIFYISMAKVTDGTAPILVEAATGYSNPLPHVLILTAIVVGIATTALGLALTVRIKEAYGSIEEEEIQAQDNQLQDLHSRDAHAQELSVENNNVQNSESEEKS
jgi:multicomponent Na+:H+ antiporter subunit C